MVRTNPLQVIVMTSDKTAERALPAFWHQWNKYFTGLPHTRIVCGFTPYESDAEFYSIGDIADYPAKRWSDALIHVLDNVADEVFLLMLDDYWLIRQVDTTAIGMVRDYMHQFTYTLKIDLTYDRLYSGTPRGGQNRFYWGFNDYDRLGYLDLIQSDSNDDYHFSLWAGMWRRDNLQSVLIPGERAQEIEMYGGERLKQRPDLLVLGTRQAPLRHINAIRVDNWNEREDQSGLSMLTDSDREELGKYL